MHPAALDDDALLRACDVTRGRFGGGPGGQNRNKVETAVRLTHRPTGLSAAAGERRSQAENQRVALRRLRLTLALHHRTDTDLLAVPSDLWRSRAAGGRIRCNPDHADYPALVAEALDVLAKLKLDPRRAATLFDVTATQLVNLLRADPTVLTHFNTQRAAAGLRGMK